MNNNIKIYIPTFKRHDKQIFFESLPDFLKEKVTFVVQKQEEHLFKDKNILVVDNDIGIAKTKEIIYRTAEKQRYLVVDDDVTLMRRNAKYFGKESNMDVAKRPMIDSDWKELFARLDKCHKEKRILCGFKAGGILPRPKAIFYNGGIFAIFSIDGKQLAEVIDDIDFNYVPIQEDVHFNLHLLSNGYSNAIMEEFCYMQKFNSVGGCSTFRTIQMQDETSKKLNLKYPKHFIINYNRTVSKSMIGSFGTKVLYSKAYKDYIKGKSLGKLDQWHTN